MTPESAHLEQPAISDGMGIPPYILDSEAVRIMMAAVDTIHLSFEVQMSEAMSHRLEQEKRHAQAVRAERNATYVSPWLNAEVKPNGASGFGYLLETEDFAVKAQYGNSHRPGIFIEMRSKALHQHVAGPRGACQDAVEWVQERLFADTSDEIRRQVTLGHEKLSRWDMHIDWQGGWHPTLEDGEERRFIRPAHVKWAPYMVDDTLTGMMFGRRRIAARIYNKTTEAASRNDDEYLKLVEQMAGERYCVGQDVWRLEYELRREGLDGFVLRTRSECYLDDDDETEAEIEGEDLPTISTVDKALHWMGHLFGYLTTRWLRLVEPNGDSNRGRWPVHPTWKALQEGFCQYSGVTLAPEQAKLVREARHTGKRRLLDNMAAGLATTAWSMVHTEPTYALQEFCRQVEQKARRIVAHEEERRLQKRKRLKPAQEVQYWESLAQLSAMAGGIFASVGVLDQRFPVVGDMTDMMCAMGDELTAIAKYKGGVQQMLYDKWCKTYKVLPPRSLFYTIRRLAT